MSHEHSPVAQQASWEDTRPRCPQEVVLERRIPPALRQPSARCTSALELVLLAHALLPLCKHSALYLSAQTQIGGGPQQFAYKSKLDPVSRLARCTERYNLGPDLA